MASIAPNVTQVPDHAGQNRVSYELDGREISMIETNG
jgi:hypothetical protein